MEHNPNWFVSDSEHFGYRFGFAMPPRHVVKAGEGKVKRLRIPIMVKSQPDDVLTQIDAHRRRPCRSEKSLYDFRSAASSAPAIPLLQWHGSGLSRIRRASSCRRVLGSSNPAGRRNEQIDPERPNTVT